MLNPGRSMVLAALACCASLLASRAEATERQGFLIGLTVGGGALDCIDCASSGAGAFGFHIGGSLGSRVTLAADVFGVAHDEEFETRFQYQLTGLVQYWLAQRLWIGGGLGFGQNEIQFGNTSTFDDSKFAFVLGAGFELVQRRQFVLDLRGRYGRTSSEPTATSHLVVLAGCTWY